MITPATEDITIYQGATFFRRYTWKTGDPAAPVDLTGASIRMQVRTHKESETALLTVSNGTSGGVTITDAANGEFTVRVEAADTDDLEFPRGVYDIEIEMPDGTVNRLVEGAVTLSRQVTRTDG